VNAFWIAIGIFVLGLMVLVHEWGHFIVAKLLGVRVETFSIGFGPRLFGWRRDPTDYRLSAFPLGGYVKMAGDNPLVERAGEPDEFLSKPRWQRVLIALAGPAANILFALLLLAGLYAIHYERPAHLDAPARLAGVLTGSPAEAAGLQAGDLVVRVTDRANPTWEQLYIETLLNGAEPLSVTIVRNGQTLERLIEPEMRGEREKAPFVGWYGHNPIVVTRVEPGMAADRAGLQAEDRILAVEGVSTSEISVGEGFVERVQRSEGAPLTLSVLRGEERFEIAVAAEKESWEGRTAYFLGIGIGPEMHTLRLGPVDALAESARRNLYHSGVLFAVLRRLVSGQVSVRSMAGPIGITVMSGQAARLGWNTLLDLMALISINLAVLNLLPIPILDGGHVAMLAVEGARKRDLSFQIKERIMQVGLALLLLLFVVVMYNDIMRYFFR